jgi:hypothetical protein
MGIPISNKFHVGRMSSWAGEEGRRRDSVLRKLKEFVLSEPNIVERKREC